MNEFIEKLIGRLEEEKKKRLLYEDEATEEEAGWYFGGSRNGLADAIEIVNQLAEEYMTCYKSCTECEAYNKEKHHCPKFCYIIAETVKEIEENNNDFCEWNRQEGYNFYLHKTSCGTEDAYDDSYKYCPYCGKKIKIAPYQPKGE